MNNLHACILAGGSGTRFWPMSRARLPKQFLPLVDGRSLFTETILRTLKVTSSSRIWIVSNQSHAPLIKSYVKKYKIPLSNVLLEPSGKNTAPAIAWAAALIHQKDPQAIMAVFPSDHYIEKKEQFCKVLTRAVQIAEKDFLVTLGIVPHRPETGYGYIKTHKADTYLRRVEAFIEKPPLAQAQKYVRAGNYFWNSGMFIWKTSVILEEIQAFLPQLGKILSQPQKIRALWKQMPTISIDYAVMEKSRRVVCVPAGEIGWSDLGSWQALWEIAPKNNEGNVLKGNVVTHDSKENIIFGQKRLIAAAGIENMVIIETDDALLVCRRDKSQQVKNIVETLIKQNKKYLT